MSADREHDVEVEKALRAVGSPACRAEFREELRRRFCDGSGVAAASKRSFGKPFIALLAAAAVLAAGYFLIRPSAPAWHVLKVDSDSIVKADGVSLPLSDPDKFVRGLAKAREIVVERGDLVVQVGDLALFDMGEGTRVAFTGFDDPDSSSYEVRATSGRLRARTGPGFAGRRMRVKADVMDAVITGTAFAVDYEAEGTCLCCLHGSVEVLSKATGPDPKAIEPKHMCFVYRADGPPPVWGGSPLSHAQPLMSLEAMALEIWR